MKTVIIGDTHGRSFWKLIVNSLETDFDRIVFLGDYFDSFDIKCEEQLNNFLDIIKFKETCGKEVVILIGNHDHHYIVGNTGTSGWQEVGSFQICPIIEQYKHHLQMAYQFDKILCTHAGVSETFMNDVFGKEGWETENIAELLNDLGKYKPKTFIFNGTDSYGDDVYQTPIWIRPRSLMKDSKEIKKDIIQVVGHTQQNQIDIKGKATGGRYFFIDTLGTSGEYLIYEDEKFNTNSVK